MRPVDENKPVFLYRLLFIVILFCLCVQNGIAQQYRIKTFDRELQDDDIVVEGVVTALEKSRFGGKAKIVLSKAYKRGGIQDTFQIEWKWSSCTGYIQEVGSSYLFLINKWQENALYDMDKASVSYFRVGKFLPSEFVKESYSKKKQVYNVVRRSKYIKAIYIWPDLIDSIPTLTAMSAVVETAPFMPSDDTSFLVLPVELFEEYLTLIQKSDDK